jgi:hypothetical protein
MYTQIDFGVPRLPTHFVEVRSLWDSELPYQVIVHEVQPDRTHRAVHQMNLRHIPTLAYLERVQQVVATHGARCPYMVPDPDAAGRI